MPTVAFRWSSGGTAGEIIVLDATHLSVLFRSKKGVVPLLTGFTITTTTSGTVIVWNDRHKVVKRRWSFNTDADIPEFDHIFTRVLAEAEATIPTQLKLRGEDAIVHQPITGGAVDDDRAFFPIDWIPDGHLVFARDSEADIYIFQFYWVDTFGEYRWDPLSETDKIRQLTEIEASAGTPWSQPGTEPGEPYNKADMGGNI